MSVYTLKASPDAQSFKLICRNTIIFIPSGSHNFVMVSRVITHVSVRHVTHVTVVAPGAGAVSPVSDNITVTPVSQATQVMALHGVALVTVGHLGQEARPLILVEDGVTVQRPGRGRRGRHDTWDTCTEM